MGIARERKQKVVIAPYGRDKTGNPHLPNPTQQRLLDWVDEVRDGGHKDGGTPILYLQGGVRAGKTTGILACVLECMLEIPGLRVLWSRQDYADLRLSAMDTFLEVVPAELIAGRNIQEHRYEIRQPGGTTSQIFFRELKDLSGLGSQVFGLIVVTEAYETTYQAFGVLKTRCAQQGVPTMILMEGNPPNKKHWLERVFDPTEEDHEDGIERWELSINENRKNLSPQYLKTLDRMPLSWKRKYLEGKTGYTPDGKPFYAGFREDLHKRELDYIHGRVIFRGIDFGWHHPACVWCQVDTRDRFMVLAELMGSEITIGKFADRIIHKENTLFPGEQFETYYDPAGEQKTDKSEQTSVEVLAGKGITGRCKMSTYRERKELIEGRLSLLIDGLPGFLVNGRCRTVIDGFLGGYHYPREQGNKPAEETPFRDGYYEHLMNAMEYVMVNLFKVSKKKGKTNRVYRAFEEKFA